MEVVWVSLAVIGVGLLLWIAFAAILFWRVLRSDERKLAKRIAKRPFSDKISLAGALFRDVRIGLAPRVIALALVLYLAMPLDLIPDFIPALGYLDDILIVGIGAVLASTLDPAAHHQRARDPVRAAGTGRKTSAERPR